MPAPSWKKDRARFVGIGSSYDKSVTEICSRVSMLWSFKNLDIDM